MQCSSPPVVFPGPPPLCSAGKPGVQTVGTNVLDQTHAKLRTVCSAIPWLSSSSSAASPSTSLCGQARRADRRHQRARPDAREAPHGALRHPLAVLVLVRRVPLHVALRASPACRPSAPTCSTRRTRSSARCAPPSPGCPRPRPPRPPPRRSAGKPGVQTVGTNVLDQTHAKLRTVRSAIPWLSSSSSAASPSTSLCGQARRADRRHQRARPDAREAPHGVLRHPLAVLVLVRRVPLHVALRASPACRPSAPTCSTRRTRSSARCAPPSPGCPRPRPPRPPPRRSAGKPGVQTVGTNVLDQTHAKLRTVRSAIPWLSSSSSAASPSTSLCGQARRADRRHQRARPDAREAPHGALRHPLAVLVLVRRVPLHVALRASPACRPSAPTCSTRRTRSSARCAPPSPGCPRPRPPRPPPRRSAGKPGVQTVGTNVLDQTHAKLRHPLAVLSCCVPPPRRSAPIP
ncbi:hypothetical protein LXA43DRAFT_1100272 [Ganoderma leucocontextum]|nr:hypothetical protein LXA43DRAFT_1100272 [Ganoderma leucocontextum]